MFLLLKCCWVVSFLAERIAFFSSSQQLQEWEKATVGCLKKYIHLCVFDEAMPSIRLFPLFLQLQETNEMPDEESVFVKKNNQGPLSETVSLFEGGAGQCRSAWRVEEIHLNG